MAGGGGRIGLTGDGIFTPVHPAVCLHEAAAGGRLSPFEKSGKAFPIFMCKALHVREGVELIPTHNKRVEVGPGIALFR
jgi:hypothetical protein